MTSPQFVVMASKTEMLSPEGRCRTFDNRANGIVIGESVATIVLKRLSHAVRDGDHIYGVIKGSAVNQDGRTNGITAPSSISQKELLTEVYQKTGVNPETISYIEAHGTGTKLGDPIEIRALTDAFRNYTDKKQYCMIGSHKPNIGHTIITAGIDGLIKILMAMKYRQIPPLIGLEELNSNIDFKNSPFIVNRELKEWLPVGGNVRRAGISAFGFSGTNCHIVIEEAPPAACKVQRVKRLYYLAVFSARTEETLKRRLRQFSIWLDKSENFGSDIADICFTLQMGRAHHAYAVISLCRI